MATINIQLDKAIGTIKPMHGGGQAPIIPDAKDTHFHYLTEAGIPYSRLSDVGGAFGRGVYVDITNIFRNFDADVNDPNSYDFVFTDLLINQLIKAGVEPYYRLWNTMESSCDVKYYNLDPPKDFEKWACICEHIMAHYLEGWADGFHHKITYWEIGCEPDYNIGGLWRGTNEEFYRLYDITAKKLKARFPYTKIGGYGHASGFYSAVGLSSPFNNPGAPADCDSFQTEFFFGFMEYISERKTPMDFFSWHGYCPARHNKIVAPWVRKQLDKYGYTHTENHINEWNPYWDEFGTAHHSAEIVAMLIEMQNAPVDVCCFYDMRCMYAPWSGLFNVTNQKPIHGYYAMVAFNQLYKLKNQIKSFCDVEELHCLIASNGKKHAMLLSNVTGKKQEFTINGVDLSEARYYVIDQERLLSWSPVKNYIENNEVLLIEW